MNKLSVVLLVLLLWLQYSLWLGKNGVCNLVHLHRIVDSYKNSYDLEGMKIRNRQILYEINDLMYGYEAIEERSRYELCMIKHDEIYYRIQ